MDYWQARLHGPRRMVCEPAWRMNAHLSFEMTGGTNELAQQLSPVERPCSKKSSLPTVERSPAGLSRRRAGWELRRLLSIPMPTGMHCTSEWPMRPFT